MLGMRKRCSSLSSASPSSQKCEGIVCTDKDLEMILSGSATSSMTSSFAESEEDLIRRRRSFHGSTFLGAKRKYSNGKALLETHLKANISSPYKRRTKSLQPNVVPWDIDNKISVEPELFGSVIEKFLTHKRNSSGSVGSETGSVTRNRSSSEQSSSPKLVPRQKSRLRATSSVNDGAFKNVEKRFVIVDEFDHPRRLSFGGPRKLSSCRSEDSVENALKRLNI